MALGIRHNISEETAIAFIRWHFAQADTIFDAPEYTTFRKLIAEKKDIAAAEEYNKLTGTTIEEAHFAVTFAKKLKPKS